MQSFERAYALEPLARAHGVAGNTEDSVRYRRFAEAVGGAIADDEDRRIFLGDLP